MGELVCFRCDRTTRSGVARGTMWFCSKCWLEWLLKGAPGKAPEPYAMNVVRPQLAPDDVPEEKCAKLEAEGSNLRPCRGRHKLTLLRERGFFIPVDPTSEWLDQAPRDPQSAHWKYQVRQQLGEIP